jgi:hypothetical protein
MADLIIAKHEADEGWEVLNLAHIESINVDRVPEDAYWITVTFAASEGKTKQYGGKTAREIVMQLARLKALADVK